MNYVTIVVLITYPIHNVTLQIEVFYIKTLSGILYLEDISPIRI